MTSNHVHEPQCKYLQHTYAILMQMSVHCFSPLFEPFDSQKSLTTTSIQKEVMGQTISSKKSGQ